VITVDGEISKPGYQKDLGIVYYPVTEYPEVKENPTEEDARAARDRLMDVVCDFPFETEAHRSAWLALTLTPFVQWVYGGRAPFFLIDANTPGSGKGLLAEAMIQICYGRHVTPIVMDFDNDEEVNKQLVALIKAQSPLVLVDNIAGNVGGAAFDMATTTEFFQGRILGKSEVIEGPLDFLWVGTGNNVGVQGDAERRIQVIRLKTNMERPQDREKFRHGNYEELKEYLKKNRASLVADCLTIWRAWILAGKPRMAVTPWGSFDGWTRWVRSCIMWLGLPDPKDANASLVSVRDSAVDVYGEFLAKLDELTVGAQDGITSRALLETISSPVATGVAKALYSIASELVGSAPLNANNLAKKIGKFRGRVVGGRELGYHKDRDGNRKWNVRRV
jgi:hypothetical protein